MCFPFLFRAALDTRSSEINEAMKMACAEELAAMARSPVPQEVLKAMSDRNMHFGPDYIIPTPFDPRLMFRLPVAVAKAAMESGVATEQIKDWDQYRRELGKRVGINEKSIK